MSRLLFALAFISQLLIGCGGTTDPEVREIKIEGSQELLVGEAISLKAIITLDDGTVEEGGATWSSLDSSIASVSSNGRVSGLKPGQTIITASKHGAKGDHLITVNDNGEAYITRITINGENLINVGQGTQLSAQAIYSDGSTNSSGIVFSSSNESVASVSASGYVSGLKAGAATIQASKNGVSASHSMSVLADADKVTATAITLTTPQNLDVGQSAQLSAEVSYSDGSKNNAVTWQVNDATIASISSTGVLTALKAGAVTVSAQKDAIIRSAVVFIQAVQVQPQATAISLSGVDELELGASSNFSASVSFDDGSSISNGISWSSSAPSVATVNNSGLVSAKAAGSTVITASYGELSKSKTLSVIEAEQGISLFIQDGAATHIHAWHSDNGTDTPIFDDAWPGASISSLDGQDTNAYKVMRNKDVTQILFKNRDTISYILNNNGDKLFDDRTDTKTAYYTADGERHYDNPFDYSPGIIISPNGGEQRGDRIISVSISGEGLYDVQASIGGQPLALDHELKAEFTLDQYINNGESLVVSASASNADGDSSEQATFVRNDDKVVSAINAYGTLQPFASNPIYFIITDRFVNGDTSNDQRDQGCGNGQCTWDRPVNGSANIGFTGGDWKGIYNNADYIHDMGFGAVWITPIIENPNEAFTGSCFPGVGAIGCDQGKTGYHGYWGVNFYKTDPHWPSTGFSFSEFTDKMRAKGIKTVLDIVTNHGSPSFDMDGGQYARSNFGKLYDANGTLKAESNNTKGGHAWFQGNDQLATLADFNINYGSGAGKEVYDYLTGAYKHWIRQGADAFRIDTTKHMSESWFKAFLQDIRKEAGDDFYAFGEFYDIDSGNIGNWQRNVGMDKLDFPYMYSMKATFGGGGAGYDRMLPVLHIDTGTIPDPYRTPTFYDNHDMPRICADQNGFINAHNWMFTTRGIPVIYYGSEMGFQQCKTEHGGNRNHFGQDNVNNAKNHPIHNALSRIGKVRRDNVALQRGLQFNLDVKGNEATLMRVYQHEGENQTAVVMLNKNSSSKTLSVNRYLTPGEWVDAESGETINVTSSISAEVPANGFRVFVYNQPFDNDDLKAEVEKRMQLHGYN